MVSEVSLRVLATRQYNSLNLLTSATSLLILTATLAPVVPSSTSPTARRHIHNIRFDKPPYQNRAQSPSIAKMAQPRGKFSIVFSLVMHS
jgi:hypothetical protein